MTLLEALPSEADADAVYDAFVGWAERRA